jgi:hypothetical protein
LQNGALARRIALLPPEEPKSVIELRSHRRRRWQREHLRRQHIGNVLALHEHRTARQFDTTDSTFVESPIWADEIEMHCYGVARAIHA